MKREERGITLLALIITIIVLLILASVSITMVVGENGIFNRAKEAKEATEEAKVKEELQLAIADATTGAIIQGEELTVDKLKNALTGKGYEGLEDATKFPVTVTKAGKKYIVSSKGNVSTESTLASLEISNANIGEYIDLGNNVVKTDETTDDWRILYVDETNVYAILADYLPNGQIPEGDNISKEGYSVWSTSDRTALLDNYLLDTTKWSRFANGISGATVTGGPTVELLMNSYNTKKGTNLDYTTLPTLDTTESLYEPHTAVVTDGVRNTAGYWLASPNADSTEYVWYVRYNGLVFRDSCNIVFCGVRPLVCLPSEISASKVEDVWKVEK